MGLQSFVLLLKLTVSLNFWPQRKKNTNKKRALAVGGGNCPLGTEAKQRMAGRGAGHAAEGEPGQGCPESRLSELPEQGRHPGS